MLGDATRIPISKELFPDVKTSLAMEKIGGAKDGDVVDDIPVMNVAMARAR